MIMFTKAFRCPVNSQSGRFSQLNWLNRKVTGPITIYFRLTNHAVWLQTSFSHSVYKLSNKYLKIGMYCFAAMI